MEQKEVSLREVYARLIALENALREKGIIVEDDEGELKENVKVEIEKRRYSKNYISHEEVKKRIFDKK